MKVVLTIAGFDPSSGAGVTADLMVFAAHGLYGCSCITALTVQSTLGVVGTHPVTPEIVRETLGCLLDDLPPAGIKIGMLATVEMVVVVAEFLERYRGIPVVLDPVLRSSSGRELLSAEGVILLRERLLPLVDWVTPNLDELGVLTDRVVTTHEQMLAAGRGLRERFPRLNVLATGGHLDQPDDLLLSVEGEEHWIKGEAVITTSTHGTGCVLSSALLSQLVLGVGPREAAGKAKRYVTEALRRAVPIGHGRGPTNLLWRLRDATEPHV
ncbi:bifunctional hydroxymethylpyrimidine kinase/phosphomethylpyrimidine kinase [Granulicella arctica]|uniref:bifunctional hydroxymethylpyrimidine kinase/phosphomethylpyrimidine kinase n=1 Tax=Granulicella arctica TaxID=940613 RepID=UPI0021E0A442|nr:bifunctional hydroxymethylpyrimidine kinase/phosphomethylpyrimidine kinase [Granulicella arctica]